MKKTFTPALLLGLLILGTSVTSCKKNDVDLTPYERQIAEGKKSLSDLQATHAKSLADLKAAQEKVTKLEADQKSLNERIVTLGEQVKAAQGKEQEAAAKLAEATAKLEAEKNAHELSIARAEKAEAKNKELEARIAKLEEEKKLLEDGKQADTPDLAPVRKALEEAKKDLATR